MKQKRKWIQRGYDCIIDEEMWKAITAQANVNVRCMLLCERQVWTPRQHYVHIGLVVTPTEENLMLCRSFAGLCHILNASLSHYWSLFKGCLSGIQLQSRLYSCRPIQFRVQRKERVLLLREINKINTNTGNENANVEIWFTVPPTGIEGTDLSRFGLACVLMFREQRRGSEMCRVGQTRYQHEARQQPETPW